MSHEEHSRATRKDVWEKRMSFFYVSFANEKFLGVVLTRAASEQEMLSHIWNKHLSPGGQMAFMEIPDGEDECPMGKVPDECIDRLLSKDELESIYGEMIRTGDMNEEQTKILDENCSVVCEDCNKP